MYGNYFFGWLSVRCEFHWEIQSLRSCLFRETLMGSFDIFCQVCLNEVAAKTFSSLTLRSDGGGEYDNKALDGFCFAQGIKREMTAPYSPHQNCAAKRRWQTAGRKASCLMKQASLPNSLSVRAVDVAFNLTNHCSSCSLSPNETAFKLLYDRKPVLSNLKSFGCLTLQFLEVGVKILDFRAVEQISVG